MTRRKLTFTIKPYPAVFTRRGYTVEMFYDDGTPYTPWLPVQGAFLSQRARFAPCPMPAIFFGNDGRKVRAEAVAWAKEMMK